MQPGVTVVLATVWLAVAAGVVGAVTPRSFRPSHDQYSPTSPRYGVQRDQINRRDQDLAEDQPLDLRIGSRGSIPAEGWQRKLRNITGAEFVADKIDYGEMPEMLLREVPPSGPDGSFVADNAFQDRGLSSAKIYNLDPSKEKVPLMATTSPARLPAESKSKAPKKSDRVSAKAAETKPHGSRSNSFEEQRTETPINRDAFGVGGVPELQVGCEGLEASSHKARRSIGTLDREKGEAATAWLDVTPITLDLDYDLSYDEEGYEEMDELFKLKRLEETTTKRVKPSRGDMDATLNSNRPHDLGRPEKLPVRGDLGDSIATNSSGLVVVPSESEKIGRDELSADLEARDSGAAETKRQRVLSNASGSGWSSGRRLLWLAEANTEGFADDEQKRAKRSTVWGFGENEGVVSSDELQTVNERRRQHDMRHHQDVKGRNQQRAMNSNVESVRREHERMLEQSRREEEEERSRRLQQSDRRTPSSWEEEEERRRDEMRRRQYEEHRRRMGHASIHDTRDEETRRREMEERRRQEVARDQTRQMTGGEEEERKRREEEERRRREEEESRRRPQDGRREEERRRQEDNARRSGSRTAEHEDEERRRRLHDEEARRRAEGQDEEARRQEQYRWQQEMQRRREEEARRRAASREDAARSPLSEEDRRRQEERHREWPEERRRQDEEERKRQRDRDRSEAPSSLTRTGHGVERPRPAGRPDQDHERRMREEGEREERAREQKLRDYIARNRPINVNQVDRRSEEEKRRHWPQPDARSRANLSRNDEDYRRRGEEERRRQGEERKLQDYIRRNQPVSVPSGNDQSVGRNWFEERRLIEEARQRGRYPDPGAAGRRGPSQPTNIDPRSSLEEVRRRQEARRLGEERRRARERQQRYEAEERRKELARRQQAEEERRLQEERRNEAVKREEEARRAQSTRYEDDRKRMEAARIQAERRRQEALRERARDGGQAAGGTRRPEAARSPHQDPRLVEHRRRQESRPIPSNLARDEAGRAAERERQRQERARLVAAERRRHEESRMREQGQRGALTEQWRRQQITRLHALPVNARIIIRPSGSSSSSDSLPSVLSRGGFENEIDFTGMNPNRRGVQAPQFPAPSTSRPPLQSPAPCIWAIVQCCSHNNNRLVKCFESMGCPGINWDPNPCRTSVKEAAREEVMKFYAKMES